MIALPHMPLFVVDLETDETCRLMDDACFGAYVRCLVRQWIEGSLPAAPETVARLVGSPVKRVATFLDAKFPVADGRRRNPKLAALRSEKLAKVETNRANGRHGGRPPKHNQSETDGFSETETNGLAKEEPSGSIRASDSVSDSCISSSRVGVQGKGEPPPIVFPVVFDTPEFLAAWEGFKAHRREIGHKMTARAEAAMLGQLEPFGLEWALNRIQEGIAGGWRGLVFKDDKHGRTSSNGTHRGTSRPTAAQAAAERREAQRGRECPEPPIRLPVR